MARCRAGGQVLPLVRLQEEHIERIVQSVPGGVANIQDIYPLAPLQEGILFHYLLDEYSGGDVYSRPMLLSVSSRERLNELVVALQAVIDRHDVLRTAVLWEQLPRPVPPRLASAGRRSPRRNGGAGGRTSRSRSRSGYWSSPSSTSCARSRRRCSQVSTCAGTGEPS